MLEPVVYRDIRPRDDSYVYIDGAFRPNTEKLLELLGGEELYGDQTLAVRELVQNAFDAVRERIAWQRLQQADPLDPRVIDSIAGLHRVSLSVESDDEGRWWLICTDTGAGMTRDILVNHLLVSGPVTAPISSSYLDDAKLPASNWNAPGDSGSESSATSCSPTV